MNRQVVVKNLLVDYSVFSEQAEASQSLLFLHGWRSQKEVWKPVIGRLQKQCKIYAMDLPGFGASQTPSQPMSVGDYAGAVREFIEKLDLKNVVVIGHSFGGRVGIKLSSQYPNLISKLVLVDSAGFAMDASKKSLMNMAAKIVKPIFKPKIMQGLRKKIYQKIGAEDYVATPQLTRTYLKVISENLSADMQVIACPTLIVFGSHDTETPASFGSKMQNLIPNSKFVILNNAGHFSFLDQPDEFVRLLLEFIER